MIYVHIYHTMASNGINEYALIYCRSYKMGNHLQNGDKSTLLSLDLNMFSEDAVTTESGNEFQMCITLIEKKFERKLW